MPDHCNPAAPDFRASWQIALLCCALLQAAGCAPLREASEENFLGRHKKIAFLFILREATYSIGGSYTDPRLLGSRFFLFPRINVVFNRKSNGYEGVNGSVLLEYPLFALIRTFGGSASFEYYPQGAGGIKYSGECWLTSYEVTTDVGDAGSWSATLQTTGTITRA